MARLDKRRISTFISARLVNPFVKALAERGIRTPGVAILETTGRKSGQTRRTPVTDGLIDDTFWIVAEHGRRAGYVRNLEANPRVRVKVKGRWRTGTAHTMPEDDPRARQRLIPHRMSSAMVRAMGSDLLTIRIDLDP